MSQMHVRRGPAEHDEGPAYATRYPCPVDDCDWYLDVERPTVLPLEMVAMFGDGPHVWTTQVAAVEQTLQAHLDEHTVVEFVTTITRLRAIEVAVRKLAEESPEDAANGELKRLRAQRAAVLALHGSDLNVDTYLVECTECIELWPCPTAQALGVTD